ncbi:MAG: Rne/Rng family ribonuclease [Alphaproteobacteria bacterium]|nr:Rne/Rng family ribonuclease [Alphaproteobacteria bacterium]
MTKRMLIDGNHPEEIRVVITDGNRLDEYDIETSTKTQLKGNIYLAKITRVEPSLQAAFVDYGGNRHGFLAFSEIHPDYFQIPVEDREALFADEAELENMAQAAQAHVDDIDGGIEHPDDLDHHDDHHDDDRHDDEQPDHPEDEHEDGAAGRGEDGAAGEAIAADAAPEPSVSADAAAADEDDEVEVEDRHGDEEDAQGDEEAADGEDGGEGRRGKRNAKGSGGRTPNKRRQMRRYKIQEVIKRRQILLVQVVKEERGNKGAALTTYLSLAGRYCVLMPNAARGGGVSRKITSSTDRRRLKELLNSLEVPDGMGVIMRTAGMERNKAEIKRDFDYLMRVWEEVRETTLTSAAPALVYEEGNLIKRAIRDLYSRDIDEVMVEGADAYQAAKKLMRLMMPSHAKRVQQYRDPTIPLLHRFQVETQLEAMHNPVVQLKSGGYIVLNPTEALVAIDVNSGKSTRERNIEETAYKTNLEAASEIARQLRLRDLAGLIVIDFIDMEEGRNQRAVEKRFKEAVKTDRARIQLGRISPFGLFEMSRQRLRPSLMETSTRVCPLCEGAGHVRSTESTAVHVLRNVEEEGIRKRSSEIAVAVPTEIALYILNQKRASLAEIERRYGFRVNVTGDDSLIPPDMRLERLKARVAQPGDEVVAEIQEAEVAPGIEEEDEQEKQEKKESAPRRRRGRRRGRRRDGTEAADDVREAAPASDEAEDDAEPAEDSGRTVAAEGEAGEEGDEKRPRRRRRGRRGGRRRGQPGDGDAAEFAKDDAAARAPGDDGPGAEAEPFEPEPWEAAPEPADADAEAEFAQPSDAEPAREPEPASEPEPEPEPVHAEAGSGPNGKDRPEAPKAPEVPQGGVATETIAEPSPQPSRRGWWQRLID